MVQSMKTLKAAKDKAIGVQEATDILASHGQALERESLSNAWIVTSLKADFLERLL